MAIGARGDRLFVRALRRHVSALSPPVHASPVTPEDLVIDVEGDALWGSNATDLAKVAAAMLVFAQGEGADALIMHHDEGRVLLAVGQREIELVAPPCPFLVDMLRHVVRAAAVTPARKGHLSIPSPKGTMKFTIEYVPSPPSALRITGFQEGGR